MDIKGEKEDGMNWEIGIDIYALLVLCIKQITDKNLFHSTENCTQCCVDLNRKEIQKRRGICIHTADSLCCIAEIDTAL